MDASTPRNPHDTLALRDLMSANAVLRQQRDELLEAVQIAERMTRHDPISHAMTCEAGPTLGALLTGTLLRCK